MKTLVVLVFGLALLELGSGLQCYTCDKKNCNKTQICSVEDSCLSVSAGEIKYKQCLKYDDCSMLKIRQMLGVGDFTFSCCTSNLCNTASLSVARHSVVGLLLSVVMFWWCLL